ncbi:MAG: phosphatidylinositol alpha-mannosyltransferase [Parcubacteria group bacterium Gr01-1014_70]|nr:MAG: phosphatidylinositol alpha-mannosyltransferase [Parcubacteria group bacterium Gr01-1014_70]
MIATGIFPPDIGGPATYSKLLAEELSKRGHTIMIVTYRDNVSRISYLVSNRESDIRNTKYEIRTISRNLPKGLRHLIYFWQVFKNGRSADAIYAQDAVSAGFPALLAAFLLRKRFFLKIVGDHAWEQGMQRFDVTDMLDDFLGKRYGVRVGLLRLVQKCTARCALRVIVPSEYLKSIVERWGIASHKIVVIPNAVSLPDHIPSKEEARNELGLDHDAFIVLSTGRLVPWKGFQMFVDLMPRLQKSILNVHLFIIGSGPDKMNLESRIMNYGLKNDIILIGSVSKEKLTHYLAAADIFCLNTSYEGFSHQLIEAMAIGIPIITTNAGGNREIIRDGENALAARYNDTADWEDAILRLYKDAELRTRLAKPQQEITKRYSVETMIKATENVLRTP